MQRAVILMRAKDVEFDVTYINLRDKPDWFLEISPHGKVPVLQVDGKPLFESNAIAEYLDEVVPPRLHPECAIIRARNRAWTDYVVTFAASLGAVTYAASPSDIQAAIASAKDVLARVEAALGEKAEGAGPFFNGPHLSLVDAAYAPFLQRFAIADAVLKTGLFDDFPQLAAWSQTLCGDPRVQAALPDEFPDAFSAYLERRGAHAATLMAAG